MATKAGVGFSSKSSSKEAGAEAARAALQEAGGKCSLAILYTTSKHEPQAFLDGVRSVVGETPSLLGGWSVGVITRDKLGYGGYEAGVAIVNSDSIVIDTFIQEGLGKGNEKEIGRLLGEQIKAKKYSGEWNVFLKYDSIRAERKPLPMNMGTPIVAGMTEAIGSWPSAIGIGLLGDMQFNPTNQWYGNRVVSQSAMALVMSGGARLDTVIMHGCKPAGQYRTVTKVDGPVILEIDGKPAVKAIAEMLGPDSEKTWKDYPLFITLGWNKGDKYADFQEENYANRLCIAIDQERGGLVMLEDDIQAGVEVQLMRRNTSDFAYIRQRSEELLKSIEAEGRKPFLAYYIDCAGRASAYCGSDREEAAEIQAVVGNRVPLLGMYSGVELAKIGQTDMMALDWTGILAILSE